MKVCFVSLYETTNFGDPILAYCAEWLFADEIKSKNVEIVRASLCWSNAQKFKNIKLNSGWHFLWKICKKLRLDKHKRWITIHAKHQLIIDNFASQIGNVDLIILAGGGLIKFKYENFWLSIPSLLEYAHQKHIPVVMNAVGVEGYNDTDFRCLDIKRALLRHSPKYISTRDDLVTLIQQYFDGHPKMQCVKVADPAVWAAEAYGVSQMKESET